MGACQDEPNKSLWIYGVLLSIAASVGTNIGVNLQKYSFMLEAKLPTYKKRVYILQPIWCLGILLVIVGSIADFVALGFVPQSLAASVGGTTMIANVIFARVFLKEEFHRKDALATSAVIVGIVIVAVFSSKESKCYTISELIGLYANVGFIIYSVVIGVSCITLFIFVKYVENVYHTKGTACPEYKKIKKFHPALYPTLSGILGAQSVLFAKSSAELARSTLSGNNQFLSVGSYLIILGMFSCIFMQIHWLAKGLTYFDAVYVVPVFQCFFISASIFGGGIYFDEFNDMTILTAVMFFLGVVLTLCGVVILSQRDMTKLSPTSKFRARVHCIIFVKRVQKLKGYFYRWRTGKNNTMMILKPRSILHKKNRSSAVVMPISQ